MLRPVKFIMPLLDAAPSVIVLCRFSCRRPEAWQTKDLKLMGVCLLVTLSLMYALVKRYQHVSGRVSNDQGRGKTRSRRDLWVDTVAVAGVHPVTSLDKCPPAAPAVASMRGRTCTGWK